MQYYLGYDFGSSSVKAALTDHYGNIVALSQYPEKEMPIYAPKPGWAEQDPEIWWKCCQKATQLLLKKSKVSGLDIKSIGISYQMHGLVIVDKAGVVLRPAIIWCDSRAVETGNNASKIMGQYALENCLNLPGNFTASKLRWVLENEPSIAERIHQIMLPGDYIAFKMTGEITTTIPGLSEGILWDFKKHQQANAILDHYQISPGMLAPIVPTFGNQGKLSKSAALFLGLQTGIPIAYRAGDQPNNALALKVLDPGQVAATGGTSGVVYAVSDQLKGDNQQKINSFAHVNHSLEQPRIGNLLCINGAGILYSWIRTITGHKQSYSDMEAAAANVSAGSDGLLILPFGNGAERILGNKSKGAMMYGLDFNRHHKAHLIRSSLESIAFTFVYGMRVLQTLGTRINHIRVGNDNLFQSKIFASTIANLIECDIVMMSSTGAAGAAIAGQFGAGYSASLESALSNLQVVKTYIPDKAAGNLDEGYQKWLELLDEYGR